MEIFRVRAVMLAAFVSVLLLASLPVAATAQSSGYLSEVRDDIEALIAQHKGIVGVSVLDPNSGQSFGIRENDMFPSASLVKMGIMLDAFARAKEGSLRLDSPLTFLDGDRTSGSGILQYLTAPKELTVWDAIVLMITMSDNSATNLLLEKQRIQPVNRRMRDFGLENTTIFAPVNAPPDESFAPELAAQWGLGVTTPRDMTMLLSHLYKSEAVDEAASKNMISILKLQVFDEGIPRFLPETIEVAHKTGAAGDSRNDCGIIYTGELDFVLCVMTRENEDPRWTIDNDANTLIANIARVVNDELHRLWSEGRSGGD